MPQRLTRRRIATDVEGLVLVLILLTVAGAAGWASFTHVHDWTMRHVPAGTPDAFGWVNAIISELVPVAAFLVIRRNRRAHQPITYPVVLLLASAALSLAAQLAVANPSPSGWLLSAVPALAFMALVKLVFTDTARTPEHSGDRDDSSSSTAPAEPGPVADTATVTAVELEPVPLPEPAPAAAPVTAPADPPPARVLGVPASFLPPPAPLNGHVPGGAR